MTREDPGDPPVPRIDPSFSERLKENFAKKWKEKGRRVSKPKGLRANKGKEIVQLSVIPSKKAPAGKKAKKPRTQTPLARFRQQTLAKKAELRKARKDIDKELKAIEKDLGKLKRVKK